MFQSHPSATRPGDEVDDDATRTAPTRILVTLDDLLWFTSSEDQDGRITLGLLDGPRESIGVLVDDNGESRGLLLSRAEVQALHRTLVSWLAGGTETNAA
jgi:hypothetical protein